MSCEETCQFGELRYQLHEGDQVSLSEAEDLCREIPGGELASIRTTQNIQRLAACCNQDKSRNFWIGLKRDTDCSDTRFQHPYRWIEGDCVEELPFEIRHRENDANCIGVTVELPPRRGEIRGRERLCRKNVNYFCLIRNEPIPTTTKLPTTIGIATEKLLKKNSSVSEQTTPSNLFLKATAGGISAAIVLVALIIVFIMYKKNRRSERKHTAYKKKEFSEVEEKPSTASNDNGKHVPPKWNIFLKNQNRTKSRDSELYYIEPETVPRRVVDESIEHEYIEIDKIALTTRLSPLPSAPPSQHSPKNPEENYLTLDQQCAKIPETNDEYLQPMPLRNIYQ